MRRTRTYFEKQDARLAKIINPKLKDNSILHLSSYRPDNTTRYQIQVVDRITGQERKSFPRHSHYKTNDFAYYLEGILDITEEMPF